jgi:hypothetical protein
MVSEIRGNPEPNGDAGIEDCISNVYTHAVCAELKLRTGAPEAQSLLAPRFSVG